jgi:hypothetical protein
MGMNLGMACVNHQPLVVGIIDDAFQDCFPDTLLNPTPKPLGNTVPVSVIRRQITPRSTCAENPEDSIDESSIVLCNASPLTTLTR